MTTPDQELIERLEELRAFLNGSGYMRGVPFGEKPADRKNYGPWWWREELPRIDQAAEALRRRVGEDAALRTLVHDWAKISRDLEEFDGDRRGHLHALQRASVKLAAAVGIRLEEWDG